MFIAVGKCRQEIGVDSEDDSGTTKEEEVEEGLEQTLDTALDYAHGGDVVGSTRELKLSRADKRIEGTVCEEEG